MTVIMLVVLMAAGYFQLSFRYGSLVTETGQLRVEITELKSQLKSVKESVLMLEEAPSDTEETFDMNDVMGSVYCCGWDFYTYDNVKDVTIINPILVPISISVKGEIPTYIDFTKEDRTHFTFFYKNGEAYYPIMSYRVVSKATIKYGWLSENAIDPKFDLGNGYVILVSDPNVPSNEYTDDPDILQKMKDFMGLVSVKVVK